MTLRFPTRSLSLRRGSQVPLPPSTPYDLPLWAVGLAAARETLVTDTHHMAALWTGLFNRMLTKSGELRWRGRGPGIGRDARIAYSGLLGRYMARAYLTQNEGVHILIPLDEAERQLSNSPFSVERTPQNRGLKADWVGFDRNGWVIAEAKATHYGSNKKWSIGQPKELDTAIEQTRRTVIRYRYGTLPARRWAVASQWATEKAKRAPMLLAWDHQDKPVGNRDYGTLEKILLQADILAVLRGLGYRSAVESEEDGPRENLDTSNGNTSIYINKLPVEPGFVAVAGPGGIHPIRNGEEITDWRRLIPENNLVLLSMSRQYVMDGMEGNCERTGPVVEQNWARHAGLTVVWAGADDEVDVSQKEGR